MESTLDTQSGAYATPGNAGQAHSVNQGKSSDGDLHSEQPRRYSI
jgi:hypothetical protein